MEGGAKSKDITKDSWQLEFKHMPKVDVHINKK